MNACIKVSSLYSCISDIDKAFALPNQSSKFNYGVSFLHIIFFCCLDQIILP